ncbi:MAG: hypothetical protein Q9N02_04330 [Ghiorsea sp.]|nr:hypothetical protein [Ghiorsea sp.]
MNVHLPSLMKLQRAEGGQVLPWPNGSVLSGKLLPPTQAAGIMLVLGNYRIRVEVPPNTPMGHVWLQLLQKAMPGQFRLLTQAQAESLIVEMLQRKGDSPELAHTAKEKPMQSEQTAWSKLQTDSFPFAFEAHGQRLTLFDKEDGQTKGLLKEETWGQDIFKLSGRLDLAHMGGLAFSLEGKKDTWRLDVHMANPLFKQDITQALQLWLAEPRHIPATLETSVVDMPHDFGQMLNREG